MTNFKFLIEHDSNPLIVYNDLGKVTYLNHSAELLLGACSAKELYTLALTYATKSFGAKTTYIDLVYKSFKFYAINVLYESEEEIAIHLYNKPLIVQKELILKEHTSTDINLLLQANIELLRTKYHNKLTLLTDYDLPKIEIHQNSFSILLRKLFDLCIKAQHLEIALKIKVGDTIIINERKFPILVLHIKTDTRDTKHDREIEALAAKNYINSFLGKTNLTLEIPYIQAEKTLD